MLTQQQINLTPSTYPPNGRYDLDISFRSSGHDLQLPVILIRGAYSRANFDVQSYFDLQPNDKVVVEMLRFPTADDRGEAVVTEVLGAHGRPTGYG